MSKFVSLPLDQTDAQKAHCVAARENIQAVWRVRVQAAERVLGTCLGTAAESKVQVGADVTDTRIARIATFARAHGFKACIGDITRVLHPAGTDADYQLGQILVMFSWGEHVTPEWIAKFEKASVAA